MYGELSRHQHLEIYLAAFDINHLRKSFPDSPNIHFVQYRTKSGLSRLALHIHSLLKEINPDFAHFQYFMPLKKLKGCRYIVTIHDVIFEDYPQEFSVIYRISKKMLYKLSAQKADILTTVSAYSKNAIHKHLGIDRSKITVIPNGVSNVFVPAPNKDVLQKRIQEKYGLEKMILCVSRIEPRKNQYNLLKAFVELELYNKNYHLVLLGHYSLQAKAFDQLLNSLPAAERDHIFINAEISDEELLAFYQAAELFVYPSKAEGFGIPPLEAAAVEIPVICSSQSSMQDFSFFGEQHIDCSNFELLKEKMMEMLAQPTSVEERKYISNKIKETYSWSASADAFYNLLLKHYPNTHKNVMYDQLSVS